MAKYWNGIKGNISSLKVVFVFFTILIFICNVLFPFHVLEDQTIIYLGGAKGDPHRVASLENNIYLIIISFLSLLIGNIYLLISQNFMKYVSGTLFSFGLMNILLAILKMIDFLFIS